MDGSHYTAFAIYMSGIDFSVRGLLDSDRTHMYAFIGISIVCVMSGTVREPGPTSLASQASIVGHEPSLSLDTLAVSATHV